MAKGIIVAEEFISELIEPVVGSGDAAAMVAGAPGLPGRFVWRGREYVVVAVLRCWKESGACRSGSAERYLRKHWYKLMTDDGLEMTVYFERQGRGRAQQKKRWWLYSIDRAAC